MPRFRVTFRKIVYGNTGHACAICQRVVDVDARDFGSAQVAAIARFCDLETIDNWLNHADWMEIARAEQTLARRVIRESGVRRAA
jgi:hypothetical protein